MHANPTAADSGITAHLVTYDDLCALARDAIVASEYDVSVAAAAAALEQLGTIRDAQIAAARLEQIRAPRAATLTPIAYEDIAPEFPGDGRVAL